MKTMMHMKNKISFAQSAKSKFPRFIQHIQDKKKKNDGKAHETQ